VHALQSAYVNPQDHSRRETSKKKRTTGATDGPKSLKGFSLAIALLRQLTARRLAHCCAGLMLALHWTMWRRRRSLAPEMGESGRETAVSWPIGGFLALGFLACDDGLVKATKLDQGYAHPDKRRM